MTMKIHDLKPADGLEQRRKRVGRGIGGKGGKTAGRGTKGQKAPRQRPGRLRGRPAAAAHAASRSSGASTTRSASSTRRSTSTRSRSRGLDEITPETLLAKGLVHKGALVKVLGRGELTREVTVKVHAFSKSAEAAITAAGGTVEVLPLPVGRPAVPPCQGQPAHQPLDRPNGPAVRPAD